MLGLMFASRHRKVVAGMRAELEGLEKRVRAPLYFRLVRGVRGKWRAELCRSDGGKAYFVSVGRKSWEDDRVAELWLRGVFYIEGDIERVEGVSSS